jgi:hypothetical protein
MLPSSIGLLSQYWSSSSAQLQLNPLGLALQL